MELSIQDTEKRLIKELPEKVDVSASESIRVTDQKAVITEWEDGIAVGYRANILRRVFEMTDANSLKVTEKCKLLGEFKKIPKESTLNDIVETINGIVDLISSQMFGEAE